MTLSETQRIGQTMQQLVWKPAKQIHTKTLLGTLAKTICVVILTALIGMISGLTVFLLTKRVNWKIKIAVITCIVVWSLIVFLV
jgi:hypothetical protein